MFAAAREAARNIIANSKLDDVELLAIPPQSLPESYSLFQLHEHLATSSGPLNREEDLETILILRSCLQQPANLSRESGDQEYITELSLWLSRNILPDSSVVFRDNASSGDQPASREKALHIARQIGTTGLCSMKLLFDISTIPSHAVDNQILLSLLAFTSANDPWSTLLSLSTAQYLGSKQNDYYQTSSFIIDFLLQKVIRPLFSKSRPPEAITASGRKAMSTSAPPRKFNSGDLDASSKPWKYESPYAIAVFGWAVANSSKEIVIQSWALFIPPLLILLDDNTTAVRSRGLEILTSFVPKMPAKLLKQTGLGEVFEDAVMPTLMFLPGLTPIEESVQLLSPAYEALITLGDVRFGDLDDKDKMKFWDRVMRKGILMGYAHSSESPIIVELLLGAMRILIVKMGVQSVKHLKDILPIISILCTDPFGPSHPSLLLAAIRTLKTTILNCWPRVRELHYRIEIVKSVAFCWSNISNGRTSHSSEDEKALGSVIDELQNTGKLLAKAVESEINLQAELEPLYRTDPRLEDIFKSRGVE